MRALFKDDPERFNRHHLRLGDLLLDYSRNLFVDETLERLFALARERGVEERRESMFAGELVNETEERAALHVALRAREPGARPEVARERARMRRFVRAVLAGAWRGATGRPITDVVNIGIGGSDLGPAMVCEALAPYRSDSLQVRFVSNVDAAHLMGALGRLDPATTLFIVASKTFATQETLTNARTARAWLVERLGEEAVARHFVALSANAQAAAAFGIAPEATFVFWDWVGGRYSLWSAVGLSIALAVGFENFEALLAGAHAMDRHFAEAPLERNMPVVLALMGVWSINFWNAPALAVLPYDQGLRRLPAYLQQLDMESNGKRIRLDGTPVDYDTGPVLFGEPGTNGQHSFHQLIHQGTRLVPCDFIVPALSHVPVGEHHDILLANALAQGEALMKGRTEEEAQAVLDARGITGARARRLLPHLVFPGNRPSNTLLMQRLDPNSLGMLIALYEHKVFVQSVVWGTNAFDQWGVELGKELAKTILPELQGRSDPDRGAHDSSTSGLLHAVRALRRGAEGGGKP